MICQFLAPVPCEGFIQFTGQFIGLFDQGQYLGGFGDGLCLQRQVHRARVVAITTVVVVSQRHVCAWGLGIELQGLIDGGLGQHFHRHRGEIRLRYPGDGHRM